MFDDGLSVSLHDNVIEGVNSKSKSCERLLTLENSMPNTLKISSVRPCILAFVESDKGRLDDRPIDLPR